MTKVLLQLFSNPSARSSSSSSSARATRVSVRAISARCSCRSRRTSPPRCADARRGSGPGLSGRTAVATVIGRLKDFPDRAATPVRYRAGEREVWVILVRRGSQLCAYLDLCPHMFLPLTQRGRRVLSADGERLRCTNHGAEFAVADGRALGGSVTACGLTSVKIELGLDETVVVEDVPGPAAI